MPKLKSRKTGEVKWVTDSTWNLMKSDGRSIRFTLVSDTEPVTVKAEKEVIEIKEIFTPRKRATKKEKEEEEVVETNTEIKDEGTD